MWERAESAPGRTGRSEGPSAARRSQCAITIRCQSLFEVVVIPAPGGSEGRSLNRQSRLLPEGFELLAAASKISSLNKLRRALEIAGVKFIDAGAKTYEGGPAVRLWVGRGAGMTDMRLRALK